MRRKDWCPDWLPEAIVAIALLICASAAVLGMIGFLSKLKLLPPLILK